MTRMFNNGFMKHMQDCLVISTTSRLVLSAISLAMLSSCAQQTPYYDSKFSEATRSTFNMQIVNHQPAHQDSQVTGMDGVAAGYAVRNYQKSFETLDKSESAYTIGIGK